MLYEIFEVRVEIPSLPSVLIVTACSEELRATLVVFNTGADLAIAKLVVASMNPALQSLLWIAWCPGGVSSNVQTNYNP